MQKQWRTFRYLKKFVLLLDAGRLAHTVELDDDEKELARTYQLLTMKPFLLVANVDEGGSMDDVPAFLRDKNPVVVSAKIEAELAQLDDEDAKMMMQELGMEDTGLHRLIQAGYDLLGLQTFFTAGEKEVHAWTVQKGAVAPQAAGRIHSDFEEKFIRAEAVHF